MSERQADTIVIGGGLHGLSAALNIARLGKRVIIIEQAWIGRHASGASAAGVRTLNRHLAEMPISIESMDMWHHIETIVGDNCGFHANGQVCVALEPYHLSSLEKRLATTRNSGFQNEELISRDELFKLIPPISTRCVGALIARRDGAADPHRTIQSYRRSAEAAGVQIYEGLAVGGIDRAGSDWCVWASGRHFVAPNVVNTAGAWGGKIAAMMGDEVPLGCKTSMMIVTERVAPFIKPVVGAVQRPLSFKQTDQGTLVIGGGLQGSANLETQRSFVDFPELAKGAQAAVELFPSIRIAKIVRTWTGIEARTSDDLPIIGASTNAPGCYHAFGFSGHGFQLVPIVGAILADLVINGQTRRQIAAFAADRFGGAAERKCAATATRQNGAGWSQD